MVLASVENLQSLAAWTVLLSSAPFQQAQAVVVLVLVAPIYMSRHFWAPFLKDSASVVQVESLVMLGLAKLPHILWMFVAQALRMSVRFFNCFAPALFVFPPQERADLLPPPTEISLNSMGAKAPFLLDLLAPVPFCFSIVFFCFSKLDFLLDFPPFFPLLDFLTFFDFLPLLFGLFFLFLLAAAAGLLTRRELAKSSERLVSSS